MIISFKITLTGQRNLIEVFESLPLPQGSFMNERAFFSVNNKKLENNSFLVDGTISTELDEKSIYRLKLGLKLKLERKAKKLGCECRVEYY